MKKLFRISVLIFTLSGALLAESVDRAILKQQTPEYPAILKKLGIGGTVKLSALVAPDGSVKKTKIAGGNPMLGEIACVAVSKWKYATASQPSNQPIEMTFDAKTASVTVK